MSLRPRAVDAHVSSRTRLKHVLQAGLDVSNSSVEGSPAITIDGVTVSTNPNDWTGLTVSQMVKLKLKPRDMFEFDRKGKGNHDPNSAYDGTEFFSIVLGNSYRFWVVHLGSVSDTDVRYYVIARHLLDMNVYRRAIVVDGVTVSTNPDDWTGLTVSQMDKLKLEPRDMVKFDRKGKGNHNDPNSAYDGTEFFSSVLGNSYRFWVVHLGSVSDPDVSYYVIARPRYDTEVYRRAAPRTY
tara:strand:- start:86 stop:802 length:717 start_codon:yes stop_codon:yes gene_type:complete